MPTYEILTSRGCNTASQCSSCHANSETSPHLFLECDFAKSLWSWLAEKIQCSLDLNSFSYLLRCSDSTSSKQLQDVIVAGIINTIRAVWDAWNQARFQSNKISPLSAISLISAAITMTENYTKSTMKSSIQEFVVLKNFAISCHPGPAACGGLFRDHSGRALGSFAYNIYRLLLSFFCKSPISFFFFNFWFMNIILVSRGW